MGVLVLNAPNEVNVVPLLNAVLLVGVSVAADFTDSGTVNREGFVLTEVVLPNAMLAKSNSFASTIIETASCFSSSIGGIAGWGLGIAGSAFIVSVVTGFTMVSVAIGFTLTDDNMGVEATNGDGIASGLATLI